jgi:hypothetical protein
MNISSGAASAGGLTYAQSMQLRAAAKQAADTRKALIETDKAKAMASPVFKAPESQKQQARAKLQQIMEWLKIVKKLYANDPKGMAKALAQVFKDLKSAVKAYKDAGGQEMAMSGEAAGAAVAPGPAAASDAPKDDTDNQGETDPAAEPAAATPQEPSTEPAESSPAAATPGGSSVYDAVAGEMRKSIGEDGLDFVKQVRGIVNKVTELLDTARGQAAIRKRDKDTDKAFGDTDKALKSLYEEIDSMEQDIRRQAPTAGMRLDVAA